MATPSGAKKTELSTSTRLRNTLYYAIYELYLIDKFGRFLPFYRCYIDDALAVWRSSNNKYEDRHYWKELRKRWTTVAS